MTVFRLLRHTCFVVLIASLIPIHAKTQENTPLQQDVQQQLLATQNIFQMEISPDNKHLLFSYRFLQTSSSDEGGESEWAEKFFIMRNDGSENPQTTEFKNKQSIADLTWMSDSKEISYLSQGDKFRSLWASTLLGSEPRKVAELENDIEWYRWSPNGKKVVFIVKSDRFEDSLKIDYSIRAPLLFKLYVLDLNEKREAHNPVLLLSSLAFDKATDIPFSWSPDSQSLVINHSVLVDQKRSQFSQLSLVSIATKKNQTIKKGEGRYGPPLISPDGKFVAYVTNALPENAQHPIRLDGMDASRVCITDLRSYGQQCLAKTPNELPTLVGWSKDSKSLYVTDREGNSDQIYKIGIDGKVLERFTQDSSSEGLSLSNVTLSPSKDTISYAATDLKTPSEGYITPVDQFQPKKIVASQKPVLKNDFAVETIRWKSKDDQLTLEGLFITPQTSQKSISGTESRTQSGIKSGIKSQSFPLITIVHDYMSADSQVSYLGDLSNLPLSYSALLKKGYAIFIPNRRGSNGYGVSLRQGIFKELGRGDYEDIMSGIDDLIDKKKVDPNKLALWGRGYGGYTAAWASTQTNRFKAVIVVQGITDLISQVGTTASPALLETIMGGPYWKDWKTWRARSPLSHIKEANTPILLQYGKNDRNVLATQGQELYFSLRILGVPVKMVSYEDQPGSFNAPLATLLGIQELQEWLETYLDLDHTPSHHKKGGENA